MTKEQALQVVQRIKENFNFIYQEVDFAEFVAWDELETASRCILGDIILLVDFLRSESYAGSSGTN